MRQSVAPVVAVLLLFASAVPALTAEPILPRFVEETAASGVDVRFTGEWLYMVGGGVATFDCNADGFDDLYLAGGEGPAAFYLNRSERAGPLRFAEQANGLELTGVLGAYPLDIDSDALVDLVVLRQGENVIMRGLGDCRFEPANAAWGIEGGDAWWTAFAATWERGNAWPTLALGAYVDREQEISPWGSCTDNWLLRPEGGRYGAPTPLKPSYCALSMLFTDWNLSGTPGLRIANDREYYEGGQEQLWKLPAGGAPSLFTAAEGWKPLRIWGMGIASADLTGDGYPDYFITSMADNKLQTLAEPPAGGIARPTYADIAYRRGVTAHRPSLGDDLRPSTAWHTQFEDVNNDGRLDLFIAKGNVDRMEDFANADPNNLMLQQPDGVFVDVASDAGVASIGTARGAAMPDFNRDGLVDLVVVNRRAPAQIWRNVTPEAGNWLALRLRQPAPNPDAIGSRIEVRADGLTVTREVTSGGGHVSGQHGFLHFGLGAASTAEVRVVWPDESTGDWFTIEANGLAWLDRSAGVQPFSSARN
ncbi:MAG: CRTAC1 family protein [Devosia sp.]|nr:CRTAC1 family protein [Devosia sp.]